GSGTAAPRSEAPGEPGARSVRARIAGPAGRTTALPTRPARTREPLRARVPSRLRRSPERSRRPALAKPRLCWFDFETPPGAMEDLGLDWRIRVNESRPRVEKDGADHREPFPSVSAAGSRIAARSRPRMPTMHSPAPSKRPRGRYSKWTR